MAVNSGPASTARQEGHEPIVAPLAQKLSNNGKKIDFENNCQVNEEVSTGDSSITILAYCVLGIGH